ncbi:MAG: hypothetical protein J5I81_13735 [Nitrococcus mobilis]|nr:hypothetical protein [Nitrococcus mobilis]
MNDSSKTRSRRSLGSLLLATGLLAAVSGWAQPADTMGGQRQSSADGSQAAEQERVENREQVRNRNEAGSGEREQVRVEHRQQRQSRTNDRNTGQPNRPYERQGPGQGAGGSSGRGTGKGSGR